MSNKIKVLTIVAAVVVASAGAGYFVVSGVSAQEEDMNMVERVAQLLGVDQEDLTDAFKTVQKQRVDEKVEEGVLDLEKAEEIKQRIDESDTPFPYRAKEKMMERRLMRTERLDAASDFLGISEEDIQKAHLDGQTIEDIVEQNGKTMEEMREYMEEKFGTAGLGLGGFGKEAFGREGVDCPFGSGEE